MRWPQLKIKNKKTAIFLVCLGISAFFWLLIKLSKEYVITVKLPVKYSDFPKNKLLTNKPDSLLILKFTDNGFDLIPYSIFGAFSSLKINVQDLNHRSLANGSSLYFIRTEMLSERVNKMMSSKNYISIIRPDSLTIRMVDLSEKKVKVLPDIQYTLSPQFQLSQDVFCQPDSIIIFGSKKALSEIDHVKTKKLEINDLSHNLVKYTDIIFPPNTNSNTSSIALNFEVEKFTESNIHIPLKDHFESNEDFKIFPTHLDIKFAVSFENYDKIKAEDFKIKMTRDSISEGKLNIQILEYPEYVRVIDHSPKMAEYIIIR